MGGVVNTVAKAVGGFVNTITGNNQSSQQSSAAPPPPPTLAAATSTAASTAASTAQQDASVLARHGYYSTMTNGEEGDNSATGVSAKKSLLGG